MTDRWIVGVDGSDASVDALGFALHHAQTRDVAISAVTAFHVPAVMALFTAKRGFGVDELGCRRPPATNSTSSSRSSVWAIV